MTSSLSKFGFFKPKKNEENQRSGGFFQSIFPVCQLWRILIMQGS